MSKLTGRPCGEGVFYAENGWLSCCGVKNGTFTDGKRVSVNLKTKELQLDIIKRLPDGTLLQKVELIGLKEVETDFYVDCERKGDVIRRINLLQSDKTWFSMNSFTCRIRYDGYVPSYGEHNSVNKLNGKGIRFGYNDDVYDSRIRNLTIGYWEMGERAPGAYIHILGSHDSLELDEFYLGEIDIKDGERYYKRCTKYKRDGST